MSLTKFTNACKRFWRNNEGLAAVELALSAPIIISLLLGGFELSRYTLLQMKMEKIAFTVADVVSQNENLTDSQITDILNVADQIASPFTIDNLGIIYISSVQLASGENYPTVLWQRSGGGTASFSSQVGSEGLTATLPNSLTLNELDNVIVTEVYFQYTPMFGMGGIFATNTVYKTTIFKPRLGDLTTSPT